MFGDARVVARCEPRRTDTAREGEELREPEAAVTADARVRRLAAGVSANERGHDRAAKLFPQIERHVREPEAMAGLARGDNSAGRAARPFCIRPVRVEPQPQRHPDGRRAGLEERDSAVDAAAHRYRDPRLVQRGSYGTGPIAFASASAGSVSPPTRAASSSDSPTQVVLEPRRVSVDDPSVRDAKPDEKPSPRPAPSLQRARPCGQGTQTSNQKGGRSPPSACALTRPMPAPRVNLDKPGGCRAASRALASLCPTRAPFHMVLVLHGGAVREPRRAPRAIVSAVSPVSARRTT